MTPERLESLQGREIFQGASSRRHWVSARSTRTRAVTSCRMPRKVPDSVDQLQALDLFMVTAARTRVFNASSSIFSPSWKSMARLVFPSRLELKRREGSFRAAPLAKVIFTTFL